MPKDPRKNPPSAELTLPKALAAALEKNQMARARFEKLSPGERREFIEWINEAKRKGLLTARAPGRRERKGSPK